MSSLISIPTLPLIVIALICGILSFVSTRLVMPWLIFKLEKADIIGKDIHKSSRPIVAEMGGMGILFGFIIGIFVGIILFPTLAFQLAIVLVVVLLVGMVGMVDDLIVLSSNGLLYMILIPIAVSICSNLTNMLAGLNGIESGLGVISMTSLTISCIILGKYDVAIISMSMLGTLIAFLYYNKYPAKVFPGDTGTLIIGATIAAIAFIGRVKLIAFIVLLPNIIDASLKFYSAGVMERQQHQPTQVNEDGKLVRPEQGFKSLIRLVLRKPVDEKTAVMMIWGIGILFGIIGIIVAILMPGVTHNQTFAQFIHLKDYFYYLG